MKVILLSELRGKGGEGDVIDVAQGYAENYLFPNRIALPATPGNIKQLEERRHKIAEREAQRIKDAEAMRDQLEGKVVVIDVKIGDEGQLFGSVTNTMVGDALKEQYGIEVDRKRIEIHKPIKTAGLHQVVVSLYRNIFATIGVQVGAPEDLPEGDAEVPADEQPATEAELTVEDTPAEEPVA
ncbi:50S ribosomal protein L9 [Olsenella sp. YH-ols2217]|uniref:Large ribosomal subunit protein bL9 n=1 Tax=Kribbibacterium absianum TaxID=3044210 RepID=A0ABT6ZJM6_9ACTN|nr:MULTISPECIES: 50S ribosomal protein L9 [unclassified Olsenella]MDJ1122763.1 50S ribosomal protein L9 [Olsenella sp. YH-ols2216]MDJ1129254.1 50S ribosomal protein L9 [Olsenella sp. YH-ols2217]